MCKKNVLSIYGPDTQFPVYCRECWWSDGWEAKSFGRDFDFTRGFFEQFYELQQVVPRMAFIQTLTENSEYTNCVTNLKDCYLLFSSDFNRDCLYGVWVEKCEDCVDNFIVESCQLAHECVFSKHLYNCSYCFLCTQCSDSYFLYDCKECSNCFMCSGLRRQSYCIRNQQYSMDEYKKLLAAEQLGSYRSLLRVEAEYADMLNESSHNFVRKHGRCVDSTGDFLIDVKDCRNCFELGDTWDAANVISGFTNKNVYDSCHVSGELCLETIECIFNYNAAFCMNTYDSHDMLYSDSCMKNNKDIFGCVGLRQSSHCILNKQYSESEYHNLVSKIKQHMQKLGEWGEFFPPQMSFFEYDETSAQDIFPVAMEQAIAHGFRWSEKVPSDTAIYKDTLPDDIAATTEANLDFTLCCKECSKQFKILPRELKYYKTKSVALPRKCFECRQKRRFGFRNELRLNRLDCSSCSTQIESAFSSASTKRVLCEPCYLKEVVD